LKDPRDLDAAFRLVFPGTVTHNANGITGNGTNGYADTKLNCSSVLTLNNTHMSIYCRTAGANENVRDMGVVDSGTNNQFVMNIRQSDSFVGFMYSSVTATLGVTNTDARGFYIASRTSSISFKGYKNGSSIVSNTNASAQGLANLNVYICARNTDGNAGTGFTSRNYAFASIGSGLTDAEAANFHTAVEAFQDSLSRGVV
jgi:hypothetical protein